MSEPSRWGPPGFDAAPRPRPTAQHPTGPRPPAPHPTAQYPTAQYPTAQYPTAQYPGAPHPTAHLPTTPIPAVPPQTHRMPAPNSDPAHRDEYGGAYRDDHADDHADDRADVRTDDRRADSSGRRRRRGQVFAGLVLMLALIVSTLLGVLTYQTLVSIDLISEDPLGGVAGPVATLGAVAFGALGVFVLALIALAIARPKVLAALGLAASLLLPVGAVVLGVWYGGGVLRQNVENDIAAEGASVAANGAAAADAIIQELERRGVDPGPLRDLIVGIAGQGG